MNMLEWAENEIKIASSDCQGEYDILDDYVMRCYESALDAYKTLLDADHSGMSWSITSSILKRLMDNLPLTPIEDVEDSWSSVRDVRDDGTCTYQCKRKTSVFKDVTVDEKSQKTSVSYTDVDRVVCYDTECGTTCHSGLADRIVDEMYPITFPYMPSSTPYRVQMRSFPHDSAELGVYDTVGVFYLRTPEGDKVMINQYYAETEQGMQPISQEEYENRLAQHLKCIDEVPQEAE